MAIRYSEWQPGLEHTLRVIRDLSNANRLEWLQTPYGSPREFPALVFTGAAHSGASVTGIGYPAWDTEDYLAAHGLVGAASDCAYAHVQVSDGHTEMWAPTEGYPADCDPLPAGADRTFDADVNTDVFAAYTYQTGFFGDTVSWGLGLQQTNIQLYRPFATDDPVFRVPVPWEWRPPNTVGIDQQTGPLALEDITYVGMDWETLSARSAAPEVFVRLYRTGEPVEGTWWINTAIGEGANLAADLATIMGWPRIEKVRHDEPLSLSEWVDDAWRVADTEDSAHLSVLSMHPAWFGSGLAGAGGLASVEERGRVSRAELQLRFRSPPYRWVIEEPAAAPPCRMFPRDDGMGTATAQRIWPPPRSQQGSQRVGPGSYW